MRDFFAYDGSFVRFMTHAVDLVVLSFLFIVCSLPVFTAGAAFSALYYSVNKVIRHDRGYVFKEYFKAFKQNFRQSTIIWAILIIAYTVLGTECYLMYQYAIKGQTIGYLYFPLMIIVALIVVWTLYLFPYIARFNNSTKAIMKNAALMAIANIGSSLFLFVMFVLFVLLIVAWPLLAFLVPGAYTLILNRRLEKVFLKYMTEEDIAAEAERNREYKN